MPSKNDPPNQPEPHPPDLFSGAEMIAMIEEFKEAVRAGILKVTPENEVLPVRPRSGEIGPKQSDVSASKEEELNRLEKQLVEWIERKKEKVQEARRKEPAKLAVTPAAEPLSSSIRQKVIDRVAHKVLETWDYADRESDPSHSLREQIVERIAEDILRRLQRNLE